MSTDLNICYKTAQNDFGSLYSERFKDIDESTNLLRFQKEVPLTQEKEHLLVITFSGGSSKAGDDGQRFALSNIQSNGVKRHVLFRFETYKHKHDKEGKTTTAEIGLISGLLFTLDRN